MTRYLLDTNILSNFTKISPSQALSDWISRQPDDQLFISSWTLGELRRGVLSKPIGRKRTLLEEWFVGIQSWFGGRILPFDQHAALIWARLMHEGVAIGKPRSAIDMIIAATAEGHDCMVVTDNEKHFPGINILNPLRHKTSRS
jgi:predicted nucleic acid-binding protein